MGSDALLNLLTQHVELDNKIFFPQRIVMTIITLIIIIIII